MSGGLGRRKGVYGGGNVIGRKISSFSKAINRVPERFGWLELSCPDVSLGREHMSPPPPKDWIAEGGFITMCLI